MSSTSTPPVRCFSMCCTTSAALPWRLPPGRRTAFASFGRRARWRRSNRGRARGRSPAARDSRAARPRRSPRRTRRRGDRRARPRVPGPRFGTGRRSRRRERLLGRRSCDRLSPGRRAPARGGSGSPRPCRPGSRRRRGPVVRIPWASRRRRGRAASGALGLPSARTSFPARARPAPPSKAGAGMRRAAAAAHRACRGRVQRVIVLHRDQSARDRAPIRPAPPFSDAPREIEPRCYTRSPSAKTEPIGEAGVPCLVPVRCRAVPNLRESARGTERQRRSRALIRVQKDVRASAQPAVLSISRRRDARAPIGHHPMRPNKPVSSRLGGKPEI